MSKKTRALSCGCIFTTCWPCAGSRASSVHNVLHVAGAHRGGPFEDSGELAIFELLQVEEEPVLASVLTGDAWAGSSCAFQVFPYVLRKLSAGASDMRMLSAFCERTIGAAL
jgi:hypothetical protein